MIIEPQRSLLDLHLGELWRYKDLVLLFVRRDFVAAFKQTVLGPLWRLASINHDYLYSHLRADREPAHGRSTAVSVLHVWDSGVGLLC